VVPSLSAIASDTEVWQLTIRLITE
jgi:hypothetical protein